MQTKVCTCCKQEKELTCFYKNKKKGKIYYQIKCKECAIIRYKSNYDKYRKTAKFKNSNSYILKNYHWLTDYGKTSEYNKDFIELLKQHYLLKKQIREYEQNI